MSLAEHLSQNFDITILDVNPPKRELINTQFRFCDVTNYADLSNHLDNVDLVIHTAIVQIPTINEQKQLAYDVNILGTHNVCKIVNESPRIQGMILAGSWHIFGEQALNGKITEYAGLRPDMVAERARLYAISKICQESITRIYSEMSSKFYGIVRQGTVLGRGMPEKTAANIFIENALSGKPITPFKHTMYRPMFYVDISDVCRMFTKLCNLVLIDKKIPHGSSQNGIYNLFSSDTITIKDLAHIIQSSIIDLSEGKIRPEIQIVDHELPSEFTESDIHDFELDVSKSVSLLGINNLVSPDESIKKLIKNRLSQ